MATTSRGRDRSEPRTWLKWIKRAALGMASLAIVTSAPVAHAADQSLAAAHFRGPQVVLLAHGQAQAEARALMLAQYHQSRRLDTNSTVNKAVDKANEIGASVRKAIKQMRGGTDKFYHDLITAVKIQLCEQLIKSGGDKNPQIRFVDKSSDKAYKDSTGKCVEIMAPDDATKNEYSLGRCEIKPNCYWANITSDDIDRRTVYVNPTDGGMTKDESKDVIMKWAQGLMIFVVPGIILAVLSLLTMIFFLICRCCCNRCGGRSPKEGGYTCMQKFWPLLFYLLFAIGVIVVAGVALLYQKTIVSALSDTFDYTSGTLSNGTTWIGNIKSPLINIRDKVADSATSIQTKLAGTDFIEDGIDGMTSRLEEFGSYSANRRVPDNCDTDDQYCFPCDVCTTISSEVSTATKEIEDNAGDGIAQLKSVRTNLNTKLVDISSSVKSMVDDQVVMLDDLSTTISDVQSDVDDSKEDYFEKYKSLLNAFVFILFGLALAVVAIGFVGVLFGLTPLKFLANIIHIAYILGFIALFITFLISSVFLAFSVIMGDVCEVTAIFTGDWTVPLGDEAKGINACFQNESLIDTLDLSSSLEFARGGIKFPDLKVDDMLAFSELDNFSNKIGATTVQTTFNYDSTKLNDLLVVLNDLVQQNKVDSDGDCSPKLKTPNDVYTKENVYDPWSIRNEQPSGNADDYVRSLYEGYDFACDQTKSGRTTYMCKASPCSFIVAVMEAYHGARMLALVERDSTKFIDDLHTNMTKVTSYTSDFKSKTKALDSSIQVIRDDLEGSLIKYVGDFEDAMYCTFIADGYFEIYNALCGDLMPALTMISLMLFLAGVFLIPVNICLIIAVKRLKARGNGGHVMDNEMKFK